MADVVALLQEMFDGDGARDYLGESVTQAVHMLQTGGLALDAGAPDHLVVAAVLHDVGHFSAADPMGDSDNHHDAAGADLLARWFPPGVTEPVRLHVAAKRYLCATDPAYMRLLSPASVHTLGHQGGPMDDAEWAALEANPPLGGRRGRPPVGRHGEGPRRTRPGVRHLRAGHRRGEPLRLR